MAASQRETILKALKTCLEGITTENGYALSVQQVRRGVHLAKEMSNRPALGVTGLRTRRAEGGSGTSQKTLQAMIYGYIDLQPDDYDPLDDLIQAVETRLMTPAAWSYYGWTDIREIVTYEGGIQDRMGYFDMELEITFFHGWAAP